eukprot:c19542_g1_i2.p1 GENE.c19542_g1_i2~~c19542_g1_i2.p1  ORF type:complete len:356 (-),score=77.16 c19542_g1_i2:148-1215(-)
MYEMPYVPPMLAHLTPHVSLLPQAEIERRRRKCINVHRAFVRLALQYESGTLRGSNTRTVALILALKELISDYAPSETDQVRQDLLKHVTQNISYIAISRPMAFAMGNFVKFLKNLITNLDSGVTVNEAREQLLEEIDIFVTERIIHTRETMIKNGVTCVKPGDVILVYDSSHVIEAILTRSHNQNISFRTIVVDSRPHHQGKELAERLVRAGLQVSLVPLHGVNYVIPEVTKTFLSAAGIMCNGGVYAHAGTALIAMASSHAKVPVIFMCETIKFVETSRLDAIVFNELGDPKELEQDQLQRPWHMMSKTPNLSVVNLVYDLTPLRYVDMVVTELGMIPPTSVPVVLREYQQQQ